MGTIKKAETFSGQNKSHVIFHLQIQQDEKLCSLPETSRIPKAS